MREWRWDHAFRISRWPVTRIPIAANAKLAVRCLAGT